MHAVRNFGVDAARLIEELRRLPRDEQLAVVGDFVAQASREDFEALVRRRRLAALEALCAHFDGIDHVGKTMTEDEIIALSLDE